MNLELSGMHLQQIVIFVLIAEKESFSKAAEELYITQSAASKSIERMEKALGFSLFERTTRQVCLTEAGAIFYNSCKTALNLIETGYNDAKRNAKLGKMQVNIAIPATANQSKYFWPSMENYAVNHPEIPWNISSEVFDELLNKIVMNQYDLVFLPDFSHYTLDEKGFPWVWAAKAPAEAIVPADSPLSGKKTVTLEELSQQIIAVLDDKDYLRWIDETFAGCSRKPEIGGIFLNALSIENTFRASYGLVGIADHFMNFKEMDGLERIPIEHLYNGLICAWHPKMKKVSAFDFIRFIEENSYSRIPEGDCII